MTQYQTISIDKPGAFNTLEWFSHIIKYVNFNGRSVIDWGCGEGVMTELAHKNGALIAIGVDQERVKNTQPGEVSFARETVENFLAQTQGMEQTISLLSMIIHWLKDRDTLREILYRTKETAVVIWRPEDEGYKIPENGYWFPETEELRTFMKSCGFESASEHWELENNPHRINLKVFKRTKSLTVLGEIITKHNIYYDYEWLKGLTELNKHLNMGHLLEMGIGYYKTKKLGGVDLYGEVPFAKSWEAKRLGTPAGGGWSKFLAKLKETYETTGLMFEDLTLRDIINSPKDGICIVDFDHIGPYNPDNNQWRELNGQR